MKTFFLAKDRAAGLIEDGKLIRYFDLEKKRGTVIRGKITGRNASIGAYFVDIGEEKPALLHDKDVREKGEMTPVVEVIRDAHGNKGSVVSAKITLGGRLVVLTDDDAVGFSKKLSDDDRAALLQFAEEHAMRGFFYRTAAKDAEGNEILEEYKRLDAVREKLLRTKNDLAAPRVLYRPRPWTSFADEADTILTDDEAYAEEKRGTYLIDVLADTGVKGALADLTRREYPLACGAEVVLDMTEALIVFDVNSKGARAESFAALARRVNDEAAREIARIIRIRNLGGIVVVDFLRENHRGKKRLHASMSRSLQGGTSRTVMHGFSDAGLFEITRQRE